MKLNKEGIQVFIISFALLFLETALFHILVFIHNSLDAILIISYALLGLAMGSIITYFIRRFKISTFYSLLLFLNFSVILAVINVTRFPTKIFLSPFMILPFLLGSIVITYFFKKKNLNLIYFFDLSGATLGVFASIILIPLLKTENALILCVALLSAIGLSYNDKRFRGAIRSAFIILLALSLIFIVINTYSNYFELEKIIKIQDDTYPPKVFNSNSPMEYMFSKDNLVSRISVYNYSHIGGSDIYVAYGGYINDIIKEDKPIAYRDDLRIPFMYSADGIQQRLFKEDPHILIIGTAAEGIVKPIKYLVKDYSLIKGIEINPAIVQIMQNELFEYSGRAYQNISVDVIDARTFLRDTDSKYDLITLLNTYKARNIGIIEDPDFLHTTDAIKDYFDHLTENGFILLEERIKNERGKFAIYRLVNNFYSILKERGYNNPQNHFLIYDFRPKDTLHGFFVMIVIKKTPFSEYDKSFFEKWDDHQQNKIEPVINHSDAYLVLEYLPGKELNTGFTDFFYSNNKDNFFGDEITLAPNTDDNPYIFAVYKKEQEIKNILYKQGYLCSVLLALLLTFLLIITRKKNSKTVIDLIVYFSFIGLGYFIVEISLMRFYQNYMGSPSYSFIFIVGTLLFSSGIGSLRSRKYSKRLLRNAFIGILVFLLYHLFINKYLIRTISGQPLFNSLIIALTIFPLGYYMGIPFPIGLKKVKSLVGQRYAPLFFAVNGLFSSFAIVLALYLSVTFGFRNTFAFGFLCYSIASGLFFFFIK